MSFKRLSLLSLAFCALPFLAACTQTAAPAVTPAVETPPTEKSGVLAAIEDAQRTRAQNRATSRLMNFGAGFDPTGLSGYAIDQIEQEQERVEEEKNRRIDEEVEKAIAEGLALQARNEALEAQKAGAGRKPARRKMAPPPAN